MGVAREIHRLLISTTFRKTINYTAHDRRRVPPTHHVIYYIMRNNTIQYGRKNKINNNNKTGYFGTCHEVHV